MEASVSTMMGLSGTQWVRTGVKVKADFRASKDFQAASEKFYGVPLQVSWVNGTTVMTSND